MIPLTVQTPLPTYTIGAVSERAKNKQFYCRGYSTHGLSEERSNSLENVTRTISSLLEGYDIRLRPKFGGKSDIALHEPAARPMANLKKVLQL